MKLDVPGLDEIAQEHDSGPHMPTQWTLVTSPAKKAAALVSMVCMDGARDERDFRRCVFDRERDEEDPPEHEGGESDGDEKPRTAGDAFWDHGG